MTFHIRSPVLRLALIVSLVGCWYAVPPTRIFACTCSEPGSPSWARTTAAAVFLGEVVAVRPLERADGSWHTKDPTAIEFEVQTIWKGNGYQIRYLTTPRSHASCGYRFQEGAAYVVYSRNGVSVDICSRTRSVSQASLDLAVLGKGQSPAVGTIGPVPSMSAYQEREDRRLGSYMTVFAVSGLILLAVAWLGLRQRRADIR